MTIAYKRRGRKEERKTRRDSESKFCKHQRRCANARISLGIYWLKTLFSAPNDFAELLRPPTVRRPSVTFFGCKQNLFCFKQEGLLRQNKNKIFWNINKEMFSKMNSFLFCVLYTGYRLEQTNTDSSIERNVVNMMTPPIQLKKMCKGRLY